MRREDLREGIEVTVKHSFVALDDKPVTPGVRYLVIKTWPDRRYKKTWCTLYDVEGMFHNSELVAVGARA